MEQGNAAVRGNRLGSTEKEGRPLLARIATQGRRWVGMVAHNLGHHKGLAILTTGQLLAASAKSRTKCSVLGSSVTHGPNVARAAARSTPFLCRYSRQRSNESVNPVPSIVARMASGGDCFPEPMRNVRHVTAGRGEVSLQRLAARSLAFDCEPPPRSWRGGRFPVAWGVTPSGEVLDLLSLVVKDRPAGGVAREVTPFAGDHDAVVVVPELCPSGLRPLPMLTLRISQMSGAGW